MNGLLAAVLISLHIILVTSNGLNCCMHCVCVSFPCYNYVWCIPVHYVCLWGKYLHHIVLAVLCWSYGCTRIYFSGPVCLLLCVCDFTYVGNPNCHLFLCIVLPVLFGFIGIFFALLPFIIDRLFVAMYSVIFPPTRHNHPPPHRLTCCWS